MTTILRYFISGANADLLDLRTPGAEYALTGEQVVATGSSAVNSVRAALGVDLDARNLLGGEDVVVFSYTDAATGLTEKVTVLNGSTTLGRDKLIFADGAVLTHNANTALKTDLNAAITGVTGFDAATATPFLKDIQSIGIVNDVRPSGYYKAGETITIAVDFKEAVTVSGTPQLKIVVGGTEKIINYSSTATASNNSGGKRLLFQYVVLGTDTDSDGIGIFDGSDAFVLNGATIRYGTNGNSTDVPLDHDPYKAMARAKIDNSAPGTPGAPGISQVADNVGTAAYVANGGSSNDATPTVRVSLAGTDAKADYRVELLDNGNVLGSAVTLSQQNINDGYIDITPAALSEGAHSFTARLISYFDQTSTVSSTWAITLDLTGPVFAAGAAASASVAENIATSTIVHTAQASDSAGVTDYSFAGGADDGLFTLNSATGSISFKASPNFEAPGSAAGTNTYTVKVKATDAVGNEAVQTVTINVTNIADETAPVFTAGATASVSVAENVAASTAIYIPQASDNVGVTGYSFGGGDDDGLFNINSATGAISFKASPDFEAPASMALSNTYTVRIKTVDATGNAAVQTLTVNVTNVDDASPVFGAMATVSVSVAENTAASTVIYIAQAIDHVAVTGYSFAGGDDDTKFNINSSTGAITFKVSPDFEAPGSTAGSNTYAIRIKAVDATGNAAVQTLTVNVTNIADETAPVFAAASASVSVAENVATSTAIYTAQATDNVGVTGYSFGGGADDGQFNIDIATGAISFKVSPDFEAPVSAAGSNAYTVKIKAVDAVGSSAIQTVTINVTDVAVEAVPVFIAGAVASASVAENIATSTTIYTAQASSSRGVSGYSFGGGADDGKFNINTTTGAISFKVSPDFETPGSAALSNTYTVKVKAVDTTGDSAIQTLTVNVTDVDDTPPVFTAGATASASVAENAATSTIIYTPQATDNVAVTGYNFGGGADDGKFNINSSTGAITFKASPDFETPGSAALSNAYTVKLKAVDAMGNQALQTVTVNVTDVLDLPVATLTAAALGNTGNAVVKSNAPGTAYLVKNTLTVNSLSDITNANDALWNSVAVTAANTNTNLSVLGLKAGVYKLYSTDASGALSAVASDTVVVSNTATNAISLTGGTESTPYGNDFGQLIAPVYVDKKWYFAWDMNGDGVHNVTNRVSGKFNATGYQANAAGSGWQVDIVSHDVLDQLLNAYSDPALGRVTNTNDSARFGTLNGVSLALPKLGLNDSTPMTISANGTPTNTAIDNNPTGETNTTYDDMLAIWDAVGMPSGWGADNRSYWSATATSSGGHVAVDWPYSSGYSIGWSDTTGLYVTLQVL